MKDEFWRRIEGTDWSDPEPRVERRQSATEQVSPAFRLLVATNDAGSSQDGYHSMLNAIGHAHSGTIDPVAVLAVPFLVEVVHSMPGWPRWTALEIIVDALCFDSESPDTSDELRALVQAHLAIIHSLLLDSGEYSEIRAAALDLLYTAECNEALSDSVPTLTGIDDGPLLGTHTTLRGRINSWLKDTGAEP